MNKLLITMSFGVALCTVATAPSHAQVGGIFRLMPAAAPPVVLWVPAANGAVPANAIIGGNETGRSLPVCRARYNKGVHPGKVVGKNCNFGYGGKEVLAPQYDVLVGNPNILKQSPQLVSWIAAQGGQVPPGAFTGGDEPGRPILPICQAPHQGGVHVGKVVAGNCNFGYGGLEVLAPQYAVLVVGRNPFTPAETVAVSVAANPVAISAAQTPPPAVVTGTQVPPLANAVNTYYLRESAGTGFAEASCDAGHVLVGGGGNSQGGLQKSQPQGGLSTWQTIGMTSNAATFASAICARSLPSNYYLREISGTGFAEASCDAGDVLVGGGGNSRGGLQKSQPQGGLSTWQTIGMTSNAATFASAICARSLPSNYYLREISGTGFAQASCDAGDVLVGGGGNSQGGLQKSQPQGGLSTWQTIGMTSNAATFASAICARNKP